MDYFYTPPEKISKDSLVIDGEEFAHLVHVMRKKAGDEIRVVDGCGTAFDVRLDIVKGKIAKGRILQSYPNHHEPTVSLTLAVGILKNHSKFDFLVEKTTELGVKEIIPLLTERTIPTKAKVERWQKLALAAMKQCGRSSLPKLSELTPLDELLNDNRRFDDKFIAHQEAGDSISSLAVEQARLRAETQHFDVQTHLRAETQHFSVQARTILVLIGPEGGFSEREFALCREAGYMPMYLGERRLRTETAAIVAAAVVLVHTL